MLVYHNFGWCEPKIGIVLMPDLFNATWLDSDYNTLGEDGRGSIRTLTWRLE